MENIKISIFDFVWLMRFIYLLPIQLGSEYRIGEDLLEVKVQIRR